MLSAAHINRIYAQGFDAVVRLIGKLECRVEDLEAQLTRSPQPVIFTLTKELAKAKDTLTRQTDDLIKERQLNHQLRRRIRELEHELESNDGGRAAVQRDSHNSSLPPSLDPPWKKIKRTRSLRTKSGMKVGGQPGHKGSTLLQVKEPDRIIVHRATECGSCGAAFDGVV